MSSEPNIGWNFDNSYARLPDVLFAEVQPVAVAEPKLVILNHELASEMGLALDGVPEDTVARWFAGQQLPIGSQPIAQAYAGHQFGGFTMLGDGRAILMGEQVTPASTRVDVQFKGSGRTPFSRGGDGLAALGPMLREHIISEAMAGLNIPTTRSLAVVTTGDQVYRERPLPGAILTRVAASHLRVGTFQFLAAQRDQDNLRVLADYAIERHYPEVGSTPDRYLAFYRRVIDAQASLIARWQLVGFIHGVMNTDNVAISGESIDYGPCAFMDTYHPDTVFSSIDHGGRYAYGNQPDIGLWNLARFGEALLPILDPDEARAIELGTESLHTYPDLFKRYWMNGMRSKIGLATEEEDDEALIEALLSWMETSEMDFTNTFDELSTGQLTPGIGPCELREAETFFNWYERWQQRLAREGRAVTEAQEVMLQVNPAVIPRNLRVEEALAAADKGDLSSLRELVDVVSKPFDRANVAEEFRQPPPDGGRPYRTFCGT